MEAVFLKVVNMSISAGWLILAVMVLRLLLRNAPKNIRVVLWGLVGFRLVCPVSIESMFSLLPSSEPLPEEFLYAAAPEVESGIPAVNQVINPIITESLAPMPGASANPTQIWSFIFSQIWILGMVLMLGYALISYLLLRRKVAASMRLDDNLRLCDHIASPFILGIFRPVIYLPSELDPKTADMVLAHEKAHIRRKDHWWKPLGFALLCVYWFNPLIWLGYILLCRDIELACDERVIAELGEQDKKEYASALLRCSVSRLHIAACPLAFGEVGVKDRIKTVLNYKKPAFWVIVAAVIPCVVVAVCFLTDPVSPNTPFPITSALTAHKVNWAQVTVWTDNPQHILLEEKQIAALTSILNQLEEYDFLEVKIDRKISLMIYHADQEILLKSDGTYTEFVFDSETGAELDRCWAVNNDALNDFLRQFIPEVNRIAEGSYAVSELLYRNPLSSYFPDESDTPATVEIHSGCNILTAYGGTLEENPNIIWGWRKLDESGEDVAFTLRLLEHEGKLTLSEDTLYQKISEHYHLLQLGEEVLLVHSEHDETVWSVYRLVKAQPIGSENMTLYSEYGHAIRILTAQHYSNGITLQLQVTFPESIELSDRDLPYPQDVWLYYATESGRTHADAMYLHSQTIDEETHSVLYDLSFSLDQEPPTGREFTLSLSGFRNNQSNTLFSTPLSMTWSGEVTDAKVYEYRDNDTHIHMTLSPISININAKGTTFQSMDELYNALIILDVFGNQITTPNSYGGSQGGSLIDIEILPGVPLNMNNIGSISIGEYKLESRSVIEDNGSPSMEDVIESLRKKESILQIDLSYGGDLILGSYGGWNTRNDTQYAGSLENYSYIPIEEQAFPVNQTMITLKFGHIGKICYLTFTDNTNLVKLYYDGTAQCFEAVSKYGNDLTVGTIMRKWYDTAEHEALRDAIAPIGAEADYLQAVQFFCDAYYGTHTQVAEDSMFRYNFVRSDTEVDMEATNLARARGELDENGYAFWVTVTFLPGNDRGADEYMAGNTHDYTGSDPGIPEGALQYHMCGYLHLTEDGWVGQILGTSF